MSEKESAHYYIAPEPKCPECGGTVHRNATGDSALRCLDCPCIFTNFPGEGICIIKDKNGIDPRLNKPSKLR